MLISSFSKGCLSTTDNPLHPIPFKDPWPLDFELSINNWHDKSFSSVKSISIDCDLNPHLTVENRDFRGSLWLDEFWFNALLLVKFKKLLHHSKTILNESSHKAIPMLATVPDISSCSLSKSRWKLSKWKLFPALQLFSSWPIFELICWTCRAKFELVNSMVPPEYIKKHISCIRSREIYDFVYF